MKETLQCLLARSGLDEVDREGIMQLYLTAIGRKEVYRHPREPAPVTREPPAAAYGSPPSEILLVQELANEVSTTMNNVKQMVEQLKAEKQQKAEQYGLPEMRRIGSRQAMELLGIGSKKLQRIRDSGKLPYVDVDGVYTYLLKDVMMLLRPGKSNPANPPSPKK